MKRKMYKLFLILGAILFIMPFTSCDTSSTNSESNSQQESLSNNIDLSDNTSLSELIYTSDLDITTLSEEQQIYLFKKTYLRDCIARDNKSINDVYVDSYFGEFNENLIGVLLDSTLSYESISVCYFVDDLKFVCSSGHYIIVWNNDKIYSLNEAFQNGLLNKDEIREIYKKQDIGFLNTVDFRNTYLNEFIDRSDKSINDVWVDQYYGEYGINGGCYVAILTDLKGEYDDAIISVKIEEYIFDFKNGHQIFVYYNGEIYSLYEAYYDVNLLTIEEISYLKYEYEN